MIFFYWVGNDSLQSTLSSIAFQDNISDVSSQNIIEVMMHNVTYEQLKNELINLYSKLTFLSEFAPLPGEWIKQQVLPTQRDVSFSLQSNTELM